MICRMEHETDRALGDLMEGPNYYTNGQNYYTNALILLVKIILCS